MNYLKEGNLELRYYDELKKYELDKIISTYIKSFEFFEGFFHKKIDFKLKLFAYENREDVGIAYGDNEPCNGFAREPNEIHFVYNEKIKCIGNHELAHLLSYSFMGRPDSTFIREGFAEFTEEYWTNICNQVYERKSHYSWAKLYFLSQRKFDLADIIFDSDKFYEAVNEDNCFYSYPLAGAFTKFLIYKYGKDKYLRFYRNCNMEEFIFEYSNLDDVILEFKEFVLNN